MYGTENTDLESNYRNFVFAKFAFYAFWGLLNPNIIFLAVDLSLR